MTAVNDLVKAPAPIGHNTPPKSDVLKARLEEVRQSAREWIQSCPKIETQEEADLAGGFLKQARDLGKQLEEHRRALKKPHDDAAKAVQTEWLPLIEITEKIEQTMSRMVGGFLERLEAQKQAALRKAEEEARQRAQEAAQAAEEAERAQQAALNAMATGNATEADPIAAAEAAAQAQAAAEDAAREARSVASAPVKAASQFTVAGAKKSVTLKEFKTARLEIPDGTKPAAEDKLLLDLCKAIIKEGGKFRSDFRDAIEEAAKKIFNKTEKVLPGIVVDVEKRAV